MRKAVYKNVITIIVLLTLTLSNSLYAQSGSFKGRVFDKEAREVLIGANVVIQGSNIGAATDLDGNFVIRNIPVGKHIVRISYIGYNSINVDIDIVANRTLEQNFSLQPETIEGQAVIITAQAQGQVSAIQQQLTSNKIANVVSEARIQELPDFNAAQAISRLPGISTLESSGEANKIVIRGLAPQFNQVAVGGISLASTGSTQIGAASQGGTAGRINNDRSVDLSMISPYMIKMISVYKSLTPDLNANALGGVVNMALREAPSGLRSDLLYQSGYTNKSETYGNYRVVLSTSNRFFDDVFGVYLLGNIEKYDRDADNMSASYSTGLLDKDPQTGFNKVQVNSVTLNRHIETRKRYGANLILDYKFSTGVIRSLNMFSRLNSIYQDYNTILGYKDKNIDFRYREGDGITDVGMNTLEMDNDFGFMSMELKAAYTYSQNSLPESPYYQFRQTGGVYPGTVPYDTVPEDLVSQVNYFGPSKLYLSSISLFSSLYKESGQSLKGDFKIPFNLQDITAGYIKFGGSYRKNIHKNDQSTPYAGIDRGSAFARRMMDGILANFPSLVYDPLVGRFAGTNFTSTNKDLFKPFLDNRFGSIFWIADPGVLNGVTNYIKNEESFNAIYTDAINPGGWYNSLFQQLPNDYEYTEFYSAFYMMAELNIGQNLMVVGGVRYEDINSRFFAYNLLDGRDARSQTYQEVVVHPKNSFWLPMVQAKYNPFKWMDIRYAYTQTLARPDYHQLSPHFSMSYDRGNVWSGNPDLKPAKSQNHDLMFTFYSNHLGLFSIGGFYKEIENFAYSTQYKLRAYPLPGFKSISDFAYMGNPPRDGATLYTFINNQKLAFVKGVEFDFQTRFWYLPFPLDGLLIGLNYTHISSSTSYPFRDEITYGIPGRPGYRVVQIDSTRSGRLLYQPNDIANLFIGYDYSGFSAKVSFVFQGNSVSYIGSFPEQDGYTIDYYRIDVAVRQMLPWYGLQLFLDVNNLNNRRNMSAQTTINGFTNQKHYGLTLNLGVRLSHSFL
jgi:TonB-dependent receptor